MLAVAKDGKIKVQFDSARKTWKAVGPKASWWSSAIGIHTRDCCDPFYDKWDDVPACQKAMIRHRMLDWFECDNDKLFDEVLIRDARESYNDWKSDLSVYFKNKGGMQAKRPINVRSDEQWQKCCERFNSTKFKEISSKNLQNREASDDKSGHGRKSYAQYMHEKDDPETGEQYSALENWKDQRLTRSGEWRTKEAHEKYTQMSEEYQTQLGQTGSSSSINEIDIMHRNLRRYRGRQSGVGPTLSKGASRRMEDGATSTFQDHRDVQISELKANQELMQANQELILRALQQFIPGFQLPSHSS
ncbi:unnamed protein product, partial [Cuscuta epithymum]